jgi:Ser/Thr protein kinase RdoA (MazF antagonist)
VERLVVKPQPTAVAERFALHGRVLSAGPLGDGHINATYVVVTDSEGHRDRRYVLQRINRAVFRDPEAVIRNVERVIEHIGSKVREEGREPGGEVLELIRTLDGDASLRDSEGGVWRCYAMIEGATARSTLAGPDQAYTIAKAFGRFLRRLSDFPPHELEITIPGFHDTARHLRALRDVAQWDPKSRVREARDELAFIEDRRDTIAAWADLLSSGEFPTRAIHNDTKISNVLVDDGTGCGICVIDLDTVMPGSVVIDIGDCARSALTRVETGGQDSEVFGTVIRGYLSEIGALLAEVEIDRIVEATRLLALELGIRFLADFIAGDRWFPVVQLTENLSRCCGQLNIVRRIEESEAEMREIVRRAAIGGRTRRRGSRTADALRFRIDGGRTRT